MRKLIFLSLCSTLVKSIYYTEPKANGQAIQIIFHILSWYQSTVANFFLSSRIQTCYWCFQSSLWCFGAAGAFWPSLWCFRSSLWCTRDLVSLSWCCSASLGQVCVVLWCRHSLLLVVLVFRWLGYSQNSGLFFSAQSSRPSSLGTAFCSLSWCFRQLLFEVLVVFSVVSRYRCSLFLSLVCFSQPLYVTAQSSSLYFLWILHLCVLSLQVPIILPGHSSLNCFSRVKLFGVILMAQILNNHLLLTNLRLMGLLLHGMCLMHASCLGFLVQWSPILSPTCGPIDMLNLCGLT
jgi:hypothetical protein